MITYYGKQTYTYAGDELNKFVLQITHSIPSSIPLIRDNYEIRPL